MTRRNPDRGRDLLAVSAGTDLDPVTGALLSITELQAKLRGLSASPTTNTTTAPPPSPRLVTPSTPEPLPVAPRREGVELLLAALEGQDAHLGQGAQHEAAPMSDRASPAWCGWPAWMAGRRVIAVVGATPGCGCSTVALALADAATRLAPTVLLDYAAPERSGLIAATDAELGRLGEGWRFGRRGPGLLVARRAVRGTSDPCSPPGEVPDQTLVVDLGYLEPAEVAAVAASSAALVLVGRAGVPGLHAVERHLSGPMPAAAHHRVVAALTGPTRWSRSARAAAGPGLRRLLAAELVIPVPVPPRLQELGLTPDPLPRPVNAAGKQLLEAVLSS